MPPRDPFPLEKSQLFRLGRKKDVATLLGLTLPELKSLSTDNNFRVWSKKQRGKKLRTIEEPLPRLALTLKKLHAIVARIETPAYLMSGKRGIKSKNNAEVHKYNGYMVNVDIESFFQTTKREFVYLTFRNDFGQTDDVASLLADLVTYKGHIPTGTSTSQDMAFWAYKKTFDRIHTLCENNGITMTLWVDDISFSSPNPFLRRWDKDIHHILQDVDLSIKTSKTKRYSASKYKCVTGSAISPEGDIKVKNAKRLEIINLVSEKQVEEFSLKDSRSLFGKLTAQRQNEPHFFENMYVRCKKHLGSLQRQKSLRDRRS